jgi:pyruvate dehydrogenase E1 component
MAKARGTKTPPAKRMDPDTTLAPDRLDCLKALEKKVLWLAAWTIHNANHLRESRDGLKVGGHQASCASLVTLMTALYFDVLRPHDRVAVKPHASPVFHAIQYLLGNQSRDKLERFRALGGAQSYPSRTKDSDDVDFSTGSVGLGVAMTSFASLVQDYVRLKSWAPPDMPEGRMVALLGDAELDEGNIFEALLEGWKHDIRNVWWVVDYNRQSLDAVVTDRLFGRIDQLFQNMGWNVVTLKYGKLLEAAFAKPGGEALKRWIDDCPNSLYSALVFQGGAAWRRHLLADIGDVKGTKALLDSYGDEALAALMTNLAGHDMEAVLEAFRQAPEDGPTCFIAYTIKGFGLPFAGHKDNHAGLMNPDQMAVFKQANSIADGAEWDHFAGLPLPPDRLQAYLEQVPFGQAGSRRTTAEPVAVPDELPTPAGKTLSTQEAFGKVLADLAREDSALAQRIVTTSPDVTVSTNLGGWVNRRGIFDRHAREDPRGCVQGGEGGLGPALGRVARGPAHRVGYRREQPVHPAGGPGAQSQPVRHTPVAHRHALRPLHSARPGCPQLRLLSGCPLHGGGDPVGHHPGAGGRRPPVALDTADRHGPGRHRGLRAGLRGRAGGDHGLGLRLHATRRQWPPAQ